MAKMDFSFYRNEVEYSDGEVEREMLNFVKDGSYYSEVSKKNWAYFYHFSPLRQNILNWYKFKEKAKILEVGAGCGAITGLLCEKAEKVVSVELTKLRAEINYERHKHYDNLEIVVGNLNNMNFNEKFDYIILNGVFEYAASFTNSKKPFHKFLKNIQEFLSTDGIVLLAIENRMGLKYFAGAKEDHFGELFYGINGYKEKDYAVTFTKDEIIKILRDSGMKHTKFYYPYPDYKFPEVIFTDDWFGKIPIYYNTASFDYNRHMFFDELKIQNIFADSGKADFFANSFLIEASKFEIERDIEILYSKLSANRNQEFKIGTNIENNNGTIVVKKFPLSKNSDDHIKSFVTKYKDFKSNNIDLILPEIKKDEVYFQYLKERCFEDILIELIEEDKISGFLENIQKLFNDISSSKKILIEDFVKNDFEKVFGSKSCMKEGTVSNFNNIDLNFDNIFIKSEKIICIDYEWMFNFSVPVEFILWRALKNFYEKFEYINSVIEFQHACKEIGIPDEFQEVFLCWEQHFAKNYIGLIELNDFAKETIKINKSIDNIVKNKIFTNNIYVDTGDGFNDIERIEGSVSIENINECLIDLTNFDRILKLRFDPIEGVPCVVSIIEIKIDKKLCKYRPFNGYKVHENSEVFFNDDPIYELDIISETPKQIEIKYYINPLSLNDLNPQIQMILEPYELEKIEFLYNVNKLKNSLMKSSEINKQLENKNNQLRSENNQLRSENKRISSTLETQKIKSSIKIIFGKKI